MIFLIVSFGIVFVLAILVLCLYAKAMIISVTSDPQSKMHIIIILAVSILMCVGGYGFIVNEALNKL